MHVHIDNCRAGSEANNRVSMNFSVCTVSVTHTVYHCKCDPVNAISKLHGHACTSREAICVSKLQGGYEARTRICM